MTVAPKVEKLLQRRILKEKPRAEDWDSFLDLFTFTFLLSRDAPLYTIYLASQQLSPLLTRILADLQSIKDYSDDRLAPVVAPDMNSLQNSSRFLQAYSAAVLGGGVTSQEKTALTRYNEANTTFMEDIKEAAGTELSADEAKTAILAATRDIQEAEALLQPKIEILLAALSEYGELNLAGQGVSLLSNRGVRALEEIEERFGSGTANIRDELETLSSLSSSVNVLSNYSVPGLVATTGSGAASGTGTPASVEATESGPYSIGSDNKLYLDVDNNPLNTFTLTLPGASAGARDTGEATYSSGWSLADFNITDPGNVCYLQISVDGGAPTIYALTITWDGSYSYVSLANLVSDLSIVPGVTVTNNTTYATIEHDDPGDNRCFTIHIEVPDWTDAEPPPPAGPPYSSTNGGAYIFLGTASYIKPGGGAGLDGNVPLAEELVSLGSWPSIYDIEAAVEENCPALASVTTDTVVSSDKGESDSGFSAMLIDARTGEIAGTNGGTTITSDTINFENLGASIGDKVRYSKAPHGAPDTEYALITGVSDGVITLGSTIGITTFTTGNARVYPNPDILESGDLLKITNDAFSASLKITSMTEDIIVPDPTTSFPSGTISNIRWSIERELLTISSPTNGADSEIVVQAGANDAAPTLGLDGLSDLGEVDGFSITDDFRLEGVEPGDVLDVGTDHTVSEVNEDLVLTDEMPNDTSGTFEVRNTDYEEYATFISGLSTWYDQYEDLADDIMLDINPVVNAVPPQAAVDKLETQCDTYITRYEDLETLIAAYECRRIAALDDLFSLLKSSGMDRAYALLRSAAFSTFFGMSDEDTTYHGYFAKVSRQTIAEYGNMDKYSDLMKVELANFVFPPDLLDYEF